MKITLLAVTTSLALAATPMMAAESIKLTTTKSTQAGVSLGLGVGGVMAVIIGAVIVIGIAAGNDETSGT